MAPRSKVEIVRGDPQGLPCRAVEAGRDDLNRSGALQSVHQSAMASFPDDAIGGLLGS